MVKNIGSEFKSWLQFDMLSVFEWIWTIQFNCYADKWINAFGVLTTVLGKIKYSYLLLIIVVSEENTCSHNNLFTWMKSLIKFWDFSLKTCLGRNSQPTLHLISTCQCQSMCWAPGKVKVFDLWVRVLWDGIIQLGVFLLPFASNNHGNFLVF